MCHTIIPSEPFPQAWASDTRDEEIPPCMHLEETAHGHDRVFWFVEETTSYDLGRTWQHVGTAKRTWPFLYRQQPQLLVLHWGMPIC